RCLTGFRVATVEELCFLQQQHRRPSVQPVNSRRGSSPPSFLMAEKCGESRVILETLISTRHTCTCSSPGTSQTPAESHSPKRARLSHLCSHTAAQSNPIASSSGKWP